MNARRLIRRYMRLSHRGAALPTDPAHQDRRMRLGAETTTSKGAVAPGDAVPLETDRAFELLELRRRFAGWVH